MKPSNVSSLVRYAIRDVVQVAKEEEKQGKEIIYLNIGDPSAYDFSPPQRILQATSDAVLEGKHTGYAYSTGDAQLRKEIARVEGCKIDEVFVTAGLSEGVNFALRILLDPGDSVLFPNPTYPLYPTIADIFGAESRYYDCGEGWVPDVDKMRALITETTKAIVVINPNNPTGAVYPYKVLKEIADLATEHKLPIFADEVYDNTLFGEGAKMHKLKDIAKDTIVFSGNSLSKNYLYPGARVGYVAVHHDSEGEFLDAFTRMCNQRLSVNGEFQRGAIAAYKGDFEFLKPSLEKLKKRSEIVSSRVKEIPGLSVVSPGAALYAWIKVDGYVSDGAHHKLPDWNFVYDLLKSEGVLVVPGSAFYKNHPDELYFRTTLLPDEENLAKAMDKLEKFMKARTSQ